MNGKVLEYNLLSSNHGVVLPCKLMVVKSPGTDQSTLSFRMSGYTQSSEDGKNALLNLTLTLQPFDLSVAELNELRKLNIIMDDALTMRVDPDSKITIDLSIHNNAEEETRLRQELSLPRDYTLGSNIPIQIIWNNMDGDSLFKLLTDNINGLNFDIKFNIKLIITLPNALKLDSMKAITWWNKSASADNNVKWAGGIPLIINQIIENNLIDASNSSCDFQTIYNVLYAELSKVVTQDSNNKQISQLNKHDFFAINWDINYKTSYELDPIKVTSQIFPGEILLSTPNLVLNLDSTDSKNGLRDLLH